jgi:hypothetical protein
MSIIQELCESRLFPSPRALAREDFESLAETTLLVLMALRITLYEETTKEWGRYYIQRTIRPANFRAWRSDGSDLYVALHALTTSLYSDDEEEAWPSIAEQPFMRWMRQMQDGEGMEHETRRFFVRLDQTLRIKDSSLKAIRRLVMDWPECSHHERRLATTRLLQYLRTYHPRAEILPFLTKAARVGRLEIKGAHNPETDVEEPARLTVDNAKKPKDWGSFLGKAAAFGAGAAVGYHVMKENTCASSIAAVPGALGGAHPGFDPNGHKGIYEVPMIRRGEAPKKKKKTVKEASFGPRRNRYEYPRAGKYVDDLLVRSEVPNTDSISASAEDYIVLPGIREVPFSAFGGPGQPTMRTKNLGAQIIASGEINPLIVMIDSTNGPYILEGQHRFDALQFIGKKTFPAMVVLDDDDGYFDEIEIEVPDVEKIPVHPGQLDLPMRLGPRLRP